jgi:hypothetical protein
MRLITLAIFFIIPLIMASIIHLSEATIENDLNKLERNQFSSLDLIHAFYSIKIYYENIKASFLSLEAEDRDVVSKWDLNLRRYCKIVRNFYAQFPISSLMILRVNGSLEILSFFIGVLTMKVDRPYYNTYDALFCKIQRYKEVNALEIFHNAILWRYWKIAKKLLYKPFMPPQTQPDEIIIPHPTNSYNAVLDWEARKEILQEIIHSLKWFYKLAEPKSVDGFLSKIKRQIELYEYIIDNFQVDSKGFILGQFISVFYQIQRFSFGNFDDLSLKTEIMILVFRIYSKHTREFQLTDPSQFPKAMLAIIPRRFLSNENIFALFNRGTDNLISQTIEVLERDQLLHIYNKVEELKLGKFENINWENLINLNDVLNSKEEWIVRVYITLKCYSH